MVVAAPLATPAQKMAPPPKPSPLAPQPPLPAPPPQLTPPRDQARYNAPPPQPALFKPPPKGLDGDGAAGAPGANATKPATAPGAKPGFVAHGPPMNHTIGFVPGPVAAMARLEQLQDPGFGVLWQKHVDFLALVRSERWPMLRDTTDIRQWYPVLDALGLDHGNVMSLVALAQQGVAGRTEANRLLWEWTAPSTLAKLTFGQTQQQAWDIVAPR